MPSIVKLERQEHIAVVRLNRPEKHNALNIEMFEELISMGEELARDKALRGIILAGEGPSFCAGLDASVMQSLIVDEKSAQDTLAKLFKRDKGPDNVAQRVAYVWQEIDVPVVAALHGVVYGGGLQIALGADIRVAAPDAKFSIMEIRYGLIPDMSITQTLPDIMSKDKAMELTLTGRIFETTEAHALGIVTLVDDSPLDRALSLSKHIAQQSPDATRATKKLFRQSWRTDARSTLALEEALQRELIGSENQIEAVMASMQKRAPKFK
jgi:enoyl-CoA hydratase/carnithine racemase